MKDTNKIIDKVRKLLAMSKDTGSPHEAAIAARQARSLMDKYQLTEMDLTKVEANDMGTSSAGGNKTATTFEGTLAVPVANFNDCQVKYERNRITGKLDLRFEGMLVDTVCAVELFKYLRDQAFKQAVKYEQGRRDRHAYRVGFASGVAQQVREFLKEREQLKTSSGTSLVVCKQQLVEKHFQAASYEKRGSSFSGGRSSFNNGYQDGKNAGLNRQVNGAQQGRLS